MTDAEICRRVVRGEARARWVSVAAWSTS